MLAQLEIAVGAQRAAQGGRPAARALAHRSALELGALPHEAHGSGARAGAGRRCRRPARGGPAPAPARDWEALERLDGALGGLDLRHPAHPDAQQLRIDWRLGRGTEPDSAEALRLIDLEPFGGDELLARRALAGVQSERPGVTSQSLALLASQLAAKVRPLTPLAAEWALMAFDGDPEGERSRRTPRLRARLVKMRDGGAQS